MCSLSAFEYNAGRYKVTFGLSSSIHFSIPVEKDRLTVFAAI